MGLFSLQEELLQFWRQPALCGAVTPSATPQGPTWSPSQTRPKDEGKEDKSSQQSQGQQLCQNERMRNQEEGVKKDHMDSGPAQTVKDASSSMGMAKEWIPFDSRRRSQKPSEHVEEESFQSSEDGEVSDDGMLDVQQQPDKTDTVVEVSENSDSDGEVMEKESDLEEGEIFEESSGLEPGQVSSFEDQRASEETEEDQEEESGSGEEDPDEESDGEQDEESDGEQDEEQEKDHEEQQALKKYKDEPTEPEAEAGEREDEETATEKASADESSSDGAADEIPEVSKDEVADAVRTPIAPAPSPSNPRPRRSAERQRASRSRGRAGCGDARPARRSRTRSRSLRSPPVRKANRKRLPRRSEWAGTRVELGLSPRRGASSSASRSRRRRRSRTPSRRTKREVSRTPSRKPNLRRRMGQGGQSKWDVRPDPADPDQKPLNLKRVVDPTGNAKKRRECYVGNLPQHKVDEAMLRNIFNRFFFAIPSFSERYPDVVDVVRTLYFPPKGDGMFAFVEFVDDVITTTAVQMSGFELHNRAIRIGRPQNYAPPSQGEQPPLDVQPLRDSGMLPSVPEDEKTATNNVLREVYFGNLQAGMVDEEVMRELLQPAAEQVPEYDPELGPAISKVAIAPAANFCFVQFQSPGVATRIITIFDDTELFGRKIRVGRPSKFPFTTDGQSQSLPPPVPPLPPPPPSIRAPTAPLAPQLLEAANAELAAELASGR